MSLPETAPGMIHTIQGRNEWLELNHWVAVRNLAGTGKRVPASCIEFHPFHMCRLARSPPVLRASVE